MVSITLELEHLRFIASMVKNIVASDVFRLLRELSTKTVGLTDPDAQVSVDVTVEEFKLVYTMLSSFEEGKLAAFNRSIETMLEPQIASGVQSGNTEFTDIYNFIVSWKTSNAAWLQGKINEGANILNQ